VRLISVNIGSPREVEWQGTVVRTAIAKSPVVGARTVSRLNVAGDAQADLVGHGGEHRAVFVYQVESHRYWEHELGRAEFPPGQFGENFTVEGMPDDVVCVGDRYRIGSGLFEITQPRVTCFKVGMRLDEPRMPALLVSHGRPGFYMRVIEEGVVEAGDLIERVAKGPERMTVREINDLLYLPNRSDDSLRRALAIPGLPQGWHDSFAALLAAPKERLPAWPGLRPFRIADCHHESRSVRSLLLEPVDGEPLPPFSPGQHLVVRVVLVDGSAALRSYSLSAPSDSRHYRISVKHELEGVVSGHLHARTQVGDVLTVGAPRGDFTLDENSDRPVVLVSAGVGATPVLCMLGALAAAGTGRTIWWIHSARSGAEHAFATQAKGWVADLTGGRSHVRFSRPAPADREGVDYDAPGRVDAHVLAGLGIPADADHYLCGPEAFMNDLAAGLVAQGTPPERVHTERFGPLSRSGNGKEPHVPEGPAGSGAAVAFTRSGISVPWSDQFASLLELAEACDVAVAWSCRTGVCHRCETDVVGGVVRYESEPLEPPAPGRALICCSRPAGEVALDL
jgi:ferredoxin-NADP reductase/MOSC domain-containing protein YiiM